MMIPPTEADFLAYFEFVKARGASGILCMARLGSTEAMARVRPGHPDGVTATATGPDTIDVTGPAERSGHRPSDPAGALPAAR